MRAYHRRLTGADEKVRIEAALAWSRWEGRTITLLPDAEVDSVHSDGQGILDRLIRATDEFARA